MDEGSRFQMKANLFYEDDAAFVVWRGCAAKLAERFDPQLSFAGPRTGTGMPQKRCIRAFGRSSANSKSRLTTTGSLDFHLSRGLVRLPIGSLENWPRLCAR